MLLSGRTFSAPIDSTQISELEATTTEILTTTTTTTTEITTTTTTTTTTLAPEVDREWEDLVLAGPAVVNYLGLFMVLTSRKDQALVAPGDFTAKHVHNLGSLKATLIQVLSEMQIAFRAAKEDLTRTRSSMNQIPDHIEAGLLLIKTAPKDLLAQLLPYTIRNVDRAATEGSAVSKPILERFKAVGELISEVAILVAAIDEAANEDFLVEAKAYVKDIETQWNLLITLFRKFSQRADLTQNTISNSFIGPLVQAQKNDGFNTEKDRMDQLEKLIPATIAIDQSSYLLDMMSRTYSEVSDNHMVQHLESNKAYQNLNTDADRLTSQRALWQKTISQSVEVARLAQKRQRDFAETSPERHEKYAEYLKSAIAS